MEHYIRRVRVTGLFDQEPDLVVDFNQSVNCIYGVNGTGKTVLINLIVNAFRVNIVDLLRAPFYSITILTSPDGKKQPENFVTVDKRGGEITYSFHNDHEIKIGSNHEDEELSGHKVVKGGEYRPVRSLRRASSRIKNEILEDGVAAIPIRTLRRLLTSHVSLTYVPLLRHSDSYDYRMTINDMRRHNLAEEEVGEFIDPNVHVLKELQEEFSRRYASAQSEIARRLESLSSIIFEKLLFGKGDAEGGDAETNLFQNLIKTKRIDGDEQKIESVITQIRDLSLDIPEETIREHYRSWHEVQANLLEAFEAQNNIDGSKGIDAQAEVYRRYSKAYFDFIASARLYKKLEDAIEVIQKVHLKKQLVLSPFNQFKVEINEFLSGAKRFDYDDSGEFEFSNNGRKLDLKKLSSGEKHLVAILGRVTFSSFTGTSTFIADEPELSLHLEWQRKILPAIRRLSPNTQVIVATHAPAIIGNDTNKIDIEGCYSDA